MCCEPIVFIPQFNLYFCGLSCQTVSYSYLKFTKKPTHTHRPVPTHWLWTLQNRRKHEKHVQKVLKHEVIPAGSLSPTRHLKPTRTQTQVTSEATSWWSGEMSHRVPSDGNSIFHILTHTMKQGLKNPYGHLLSQMGFNMWECPAVKVFTLYTAV